MVDLCKKHFVLDHQILLLLKYNMLIFVVNGIYLYIMDRPAIIECNYGKFHWSGKG